MSQPVERVRKTGATVALLVLLTLSNVFVLVVGSVGWVDAADHGADWDDESLRALVFATLMSLTAVVGLVGAWLTRKWGPRLYLVAAGAGLVVGLVLAEGVVSPFSFLGIGLAAVLWLTAESNW